MASKTAPTYTTQIERAQAEAARLREQQREAEREAAALVEDKRQAEADARRAWADEQVGRLREIFAPVDAARAAAAEAFKAGDPAAHALWIKWRCTFRAAEAEWSVVAHAYEQAHADEGLRAPRGRSLTGRSPDGTSAETWEIYSHRMTLKLTEDAGKAARDATLGQLAEAIGAADLGDVARSVEPLARYMRGKVVDGNVIPWPGRHGRVPITFGKTGIALVFDPEHVEILEADPACARVPDDESAA